MLELFGMFVLALAPIIWLVIALCGMHMKAHLASLGALVVAAVCAMLGWGMTPVNMATAALEGFAMALWPIVIVIIDLQRDRAHERHGDDQGHALLGI